MLNQKTQASLGDRATHGVAWNIVANVGIKLLTAVTQLVLAWYLTPADFGLAATALSISGMAQILRTGGLHVILVRTRRGWLALGAQAFYIGLIVNGLISLVICVASPWIADWYQDSRLVPLLCIVSLSFPLQQFGLVQSAWLTRKMRFKRLSVINLAASLVRTLGQIALALSGWGVYSLILPMFPAIALQVFATRASTPHFPLAPPRPQKWLKLWKDTFLLNFNGFLDVVGQYGATLTVSLALSATATGLFFWAHALAGQAIYLLGNALNGVFLAVFSHVNEDDGRQRNVFLNTTAALTLLVAPICVLQALIAQDAFQLVLAPDWQPGWVVFAWVSLSLIVQPLVITARSLLMAQGRFRRLIATNACAVLIPLAATLLAIPTGSLSWVAFANASGVTLGALAAILLALAPLEISWQATLVAYIKPYSLVLPAALVALAVQSLLANNLMRVLCPALAFAVSYLFTLRAFGGPGYEIIAARLKKACQSFKLAGAIG